MKKKLITLLTAAILVTAMSTTAFAGTWKQNNTGWYYVNEELDFYRGCGQWIESGNTGTYEYYYFDNEGYCLTNTVSPDGKTMNEDGKWVIDGVVQKKSAADIPESLGMNENYAKLLYGTKADILAFCGEPDWVYGGSLTHSVGYQIPYLSVTLNANDEVNRFEIYMGTLFDFNIPMPIDDFVQALGLQANQVSYLYQEDLDCEQYSILTNGARVMFDAQMGKVIPGSSASVSRNGKTAFSGAQTYFPGQASQQKAPSVLEGPKDTQSVATVTYYGKLRVSQTGELLELDTYSENYDQSEYTLYDETGTIWLSLKDRPEWRAFSGRRVAVTGDLVKEVELSDVTFYGIKVKSVTLQ